jgi:glycerol-3-phosphate dehydrogenase
VLAFPTVDGKVIAGPTAVDQDDKDDWSVRAEAHEEIIHKVCTLHPPLADAPVVAAYAGLRPAGRGVNYVIGVSTACPALINVAAIRSTGLTASLGIAERVVAIASTVGVALGPEEELRRGERPRSGGPWWQRTAMHKVAA